MMAAQPDPYAPCEESCTHDLATGVLVDELLGADGPYPPVWTPVRAAGWLAVVHDQDEDDESAA